MCPPVMFANRRIVSAHGFTMSPISSTRKSKGQSQPGTCGTRPVQNLCGPRTYIPPKIMIVNVISARAAVTVLLFTSPISTHALARAALSGGVQPYTTVGER